MGRIRLVVNAGDFGMTSNFRRHHLRAQPRNGDKLLADRKLRRPRLRRSSAPECASVGRRPALDVVWTVLRCLQWLQGRATIGATVSSVGFLQSGHLDEESLYALISRLHPGDYELVCHPGVDGGEIPCEPRRRTYRPGLELQALTSAKIRELIREREIDPCRWFDLSRGVTAGDRSARRMVRRATMTSDAPLTRTQSRPVPGRTGDSPRC